MKKTIEIITIDVNIKASSNIQTQIDQIKAVIDPQIATLNEKLTDTEIVALYLPVSDGIGVATNMMSVNNGGIEQHKLFDHDSTLLYNRHD